MKYLRWIVFITYPIFAQVSDDFNDGNFTENPTWFGQQNNFEIDSLFRLHLNAPSENSSSYLCLKSQILENAKWEMNLKMDFNPSGSNFTDWYFMANDSILKDATQAYFVRIGNTADEVSLYKQENGVITKIIDGLDNRVDVNPVEIRLKVERNEGANFSLWVDILDGNSWVLEGETEDYSYTNSSYSGVLCTYTSTRSDKFYFDNFSITGSTYIDSVPPNLTQTVIADSNTLQLTFEQGDLAETTGELFEVLPGENHPETISQFENTVMLYFENSLPINESFELYVHTLADTNGNIMPDTLLDFYIQKHQRFDVVINEIMIDPEPQVQLSNAEYVELYNRANYPLNLCGWKLYIDDTAVQFDSIVIPEQSYLLLTRTSDSLLFENYDSYSLALSILNNTEAYLGLFDANNQLVHEINYTKDWYQNLNKENGGWSLEMMDSENYCAGKSNWRSCENLLGGTPGFTNSIQTVNPDNSAPVLTDILLVDNNEILLKWSENIYDSTIYFFNAYSFTNNLTPNSIYHFMNETYIQFFDELEEGIVYEIQIDNLADCQGNQSNIDSEFVRGVWAEEGMMVINEILFNPKTDGYDYVELYNTSNEYINLSKLLIGQYDSLLQAISNTEIISEQNINLPPYTYLAICEDTAWLKQNYHFDSTLFYMQVKQLPSLPNVEGSVVISSLAYEVIDAISYHENTHFPLLETVDGVALERLNFESEEWFSASSIENYGTPGRENSQFTYTKTPNSTIDISPEVFNPNNNGYKDFTHITVIPDQAAKTTISIYDKRGLLVKEICNSELVNKETSWIWNGVNQNNLLPPLGIYMVIVRLIYEDGKQQTLKHPVVIAAN